MRDSLGNVTEQRVYEYGDLTTPARTYRNYLTYIASAFLPTKSEVVEGSTTLVLGEWKYDGAEGGVCSGLGSWLNDAAGMTYHDAAYGTGNTGRGLVTWSKALGSAAGCVRYDIGGNAVKSGVVGGASAQFSVTSASQWTAASTVTPNGEANLASSYQWDSQLKLTSASGPNGASTSIGYDAMARPASTTSVHGAVTSFVYTATATTATTNGKWVKTTTDGLGRTVKVETGHGSTTVSVVETEYGACACSALGKVKRVSMPYNPAAVPLVKHWTEYEYDARGRTTKVTPPGGARFTEYIYAGNTVKVIEPVVARWKRFTMDARGRLVKVTEPRPGVSGVTDDTLYSYNALDKLTQVSMTRGATTEIRSFVFDSEMRLASVTQPENGTTSYTYDSLSRIATRTDAKGQRAEYSYDAYNRVTLVKRFVGGVEDVGQRTSMMYDLGENGWGRVGMIGTNGFSEWYSYTAGGLVKKKSVVVSGAQKPLVAEWTYDNEGRRTSLKYPDLYNWAQYPEDATVSEVGKKVLYQYDAAGRWTGVQDWLTSEMMASNAAYNAAGQLTSVTLPYGQSDQYTYNVRGQLTREQHAGGVDISYGYSATANDGRLISKTDGATVEYQYDELGRLSKAETTGTGWGLSWSYDGFGNRLQQNLIKGTAPAPVVTVNAANNRISTLGFGYDDNGNMTAWPHGGGTATGTFDVENRMVGVVSGSVTESYSYNAANQRVRQQRGTEDPKVFFYGLEGELLGVYWHYGLTFSRVETRAYFQGRRLREGSADDAEDRMGSVRWQQRGGTTRTFNYFPYGEQMGGASDEDQRKFGTYTRDSVGGLDYAWNRYYSATWGRFTSADQGAPDPAAPQSWNRYSYSWNDPVNLYDPDGQLPAAPSFVAPGQGGSLPTLPTPSVWFYWSGSWGIGNGSPTMTPLQRVHALVTALEEFIDNVSPDPNGGFQITMGADTFSLLQGAGILSNTLQPVPAALPNPAAWDRAVRVIVRAGWVLAAAISDYLQRTRPKEWEVDCSTH